MKYLLLAFNTFTCYCLTAKTINMDLYLRELYNSKQYKTCYQLSKIISADNYSNYTLSPFSIKWRRNNVYVSDSAKFYEYKSLKEFDLNSFYYHYAVKNSEVLTYFTKSDIHDAFVAWADSLYNSPMHDETELFYKFLKSKKRVNRDEIPEVKNEIYKRYRLYEIYKFLKIADTVALAKIFNVDNSALIELVRNRVDKDLLKLHSNNFNMETCEVFYNGKNNKIQDEVREYFYSLFMEKRFVNREQIANYLYQGTNFTDEEKMFVTFYFLQQFLGYSKTSKFSHSKDIKRIILYRQTVCDGYATLLQYFLNKNNIETYHICVSTNKNSHANNLILINGKAYFADVTWCIYYTIVKDFGYVQIVNDNKDITVEKKYYFRKYIMK